MTIIYDRDHLPTGDWNEWRKRGATRMIPMVGPCTIVTREDKYHLPDGWQGFLAVDVDGYPYPVNAEVHRDSYDPAEDVIPDWRTEILALAERYYDHGHILEGDSNWPAAQAFHDAYNDLCGLVARVDPRPGGTSTPGKPW